VPRLGPKPNEPQWTITVSSGGLDSWMLTWNLAVAAGTKIN